MYAMKKKKSEKKNPDGCLDGIQHGSITGQGTFTVTKARTSLLIKHKK